MGSDTEDDDDCALNGLLRPSEDDISLFLDTLSEYRFVKYQTCLMEQVSGVSFRIFAPTKKNELEGMFGILPIEFVKEKTYGTVRQRVRNSYTFYDISACVGNFEEKREKYYAVDFKDCHDKLFDGAKVCFHIGILRRQLKGYDFQAYDVTYSPLEKLYISPDIFFAPLHDGEKFAKYMKDVYYVDIDCRKKYCVGWILNENL